MKSPDYRTEEQAELRRTQSMKLRIKGYSYQEIGNELGVSRAQAHKDVKKVLERTREEGDDCATEAREIDLARIDGAIRSVDEIMNGFDPELKLKAVDRMVRLQERRAKLLGLDAPVKQELAGTVGVASPEEAARLVREKFGSHGAKADGAT